MKGGHQVRIKLFTCPVVPPAPRFYLAGRAGRRGRWSSRQTHRQLQRFVRIRGFIRRVILVDSQTRPISRHAVIDQHRHRLRLIAPTAGRMHGSYAPPPPEARAFLHPWPHQALAVPLRENLLTNPS